MEASSLGPMSNFMPPLPKTGPTENPLISVIPAKVKSISYVVATNAASCDAQRRSGLTRPLEQPAYRRPA